MKGLILFGRIMNVYVHGNGTIAQGHAPIYYVVLHNLSRPFRFCHVCCTPSTTSLRPATASIRYATLMTKSLPSTKNLWRFATFPCDPDRRYRPFPIWHVLLRSVASTHDCHHVVTTVSLRRDQSYYIHTTSTHVQLEAHVISRPF